MIVSKLSVLQAWLIFIVPSLCLLLIWCVTEVFPNKIDVTQSCVVDEIVDKTHQCINKTILCQLPRSYINIKLDVTSVSTLDIPPAVDSASIGKMESTLESRVALTDAHVFLLSTHYDNNNATAKYGYPLLFNKILTYDTSIAPVISDSDNILDMTWYHVPNSLNSLLHAGTHWLGFGTHDENLRDWSHISASSIAQFHQLFAGQFEWPELSILIPVSFRIDLHPLSLAAPATYYSYNADSVTDHLTQSGGNRNILGGDEKNEKVLAGPGSLTGFMKVQTSQRLSIRRNARAASPASSAIDGTPVDEATWASLITCRHNNSMVGTESSDTYAIDSDLTTNCSLLSNWLGGQHTDITVTASNTWAIEFELFLTLLLSAVSIMLLGIFVHRLLLQGAILYKKLKAQDDKVMGQKNSENSGRLSRSGDLFSPVSMLDGDDEEEQDVEVDEYSYLLGDALDHGGARGVWGYFRYYCCEYNCCRVVRYNLHYYRYVFATLVPEQIYATMLLVSLLCYQGGLGTVACVLGGISKIWGVGMVPSTYASWRLVGYVWTDLTLFMASFSRYMTVVGCQGVWLCMWLIVDSLQYTVQVPEWTQDAPPTFSHDESDMDIDTPITNYSSGLKLDLPSQIKRNRSRHRLSSSLKNGMDRTDRSDYGSFASLTRGKHTRKSEEPVYVSFRSEDNWGRPRGASDFDNTGVSTALETDSQGELEAPWGLTTLWNVAQYVTGTCCTCSIRVIKCCYYRDMACLWRNTYDTGDEMECPTLLSSCGHWLCCCGSCCVLCNTDDPPAPTKRTAAYKPPTPLLRVSHPLYTRLIDPRDPFASLVHTDEPLEGIKEVKSFSQFIIPKLKVYAVSVLISILYIYTNGEAMAYLQTPISPPPNIQRPDRFPGVVNPAYEIPVHYPIGEMCIPYFPLENSSTIANGLGQVSGFGDNQSFSGLIGNNEKSGKGRYVGEPYWSWWFMYLLEGLLSVLMCVVQLIWWTVLLKSFYKSGVVLRKSSFMSSRFNQLFYRMMANQAIAFLLMMVGLVSYIVHVDVVGQYWHLYSKGGTQGDAGKDTDAIDLNVVIYNTLTLIRLSYRSIWDVLNTLIEHPSNSLSLLYLSLMVYITVLMLMPDGICRDNQSGEVISTKQYRLYYNKHSLEFIFSGSLGSTPVVPGSLASCETPSRYVDTSSMIHPKNFIVSERNLELHILKGLWEQDKRSGEDCADNRFALGASVGVSGLRSRLRRNMLEMRSRIRKYLTKMRYMNAFDPKPDINTRSSGSSTRSARNLVGSAEVEELEMVEDGVGDIITDSISTSGTPLPPGTSPSLNIPSLSGEGNVQMGVISGPGTESDIPSDQEPFCLEMASKLLECSEQAYYMRNVPRVVETEAPPSLSMRFRGLFQLSPLEGEEESQFGWLGIGGLDLNHNEDNMSSTVGTSDGNDSNVVFTAAYYLVNSSVQMFSAVVNILGTGLNACWVGVFETYNDSDNAGAGIAPVRTTDIASDADSTDSNVSQDEEMFSLTDCNLLLAARFENFATSTGGFIAVSPSCISTGVVGEASTANRKESDHDSILSDVVECFSDERGPDMERYHASLKSLANYIEDSSFHTLEGDSVNKSNPDHSPFTSASESTDLVVVCFRGTASNDNIITDLSFTQIPLPNMVLSRSYFEFIVEHAGLGINSEKKRNADNTIKHSKSKESRFSYNSEDSYDVENCEIIRQSSSVSCSDHEADLDSVSMSSDFSVGSRTMHGNVHGSEFASDLEYESGTGAGSRWDRDLEARAMRSLSVESGDDLIPESAENKARRKRIRKLLQSSHDPASELSLFWCLSYDCLRWCSGTLPAVFREFAPRVHSGFWNAYLSVRNDMMRAITVILLKRAILQHSERGYNVETNSQLGSELLEGKIDKSRGPPTMTKKQKVPQLRIYCTGHSLGGALTSFASLDLSINMPAIQSAVSKCVARHISKYRGTNGIKHQSLSSHINASDSIQDGENGVFKNTSSPLLHIPASYQQTNNVETNPQVPRRGFEPDMETIGVHVEEPILTVYTFGAPRMGNKTFATLIEQCLQSSYCESLENECTNYYRCVLDGDLVPMVPKQMLYLLGNWKHCGVGVLIDNEVKGNMIINPSVLEAQLLRKHSTGKIEYHSLSSYRECILACYPTDMPDKTGNTNNDTESEIQKSCAFGNWANEVTDKADSKAFSPECRWMDPKNDVCGGVNNRMNSDPLTSEGRNAIEKEFDEFVPRWMDPSNDRKS